MRRGVEPPVTRGGSEPEHPGSGQRWDIAGHFPNEQAALKVLYNHVAVQRRPNRERESHSG